VITHFYSDPHFGHTNIIKYCDRPFASVDEMNEELVARYNASVGPDDFVPA
jgi:calcineurin-like phosphoesterase family protein